MEAASSRSISSWGISVPFRIDDARSTTWKEKRGEESPREFKRNCVGDYSIEV